MTIEKPTDSNNHLSETNIFREALTILNTKNGHDMSEEETEKLTTAIIPLMLLPQYSHISITKGLEELANMIEERKDDLYVYS